MAREIPLLDPQAVSAADYARRHNRPKQVLGITSHEIGKLHPEDVTRIAENPAQGSVLADLAQLQVGANVHIATRAYSPRRSFRALERAAETIALVHHNPDLVASVQSQPSTKIGEEVPFAATLPASNAEVLYSAVPLYQGVQRHALFDRATQLSEEAHEALPEDHPTRSILRMQQQVAAFSEGKDLNRERLAKDFEIMQTVEKSSPEQFITAASLVFNLGRVLRDPELFTAGVMALKPYEVDKQPDLTVIRTNIHYATDMRRWQNTKFGLLVPALTRSKRRENLHTTLLQG